MDKFFRMISGISEKFPLEWTATAFVCSSGLCLYLFDGFTVSGFLPNLSRSTESISPVYAFFMVSSGLTALITGITGVYSLIKWFESK